jgi:hypothetical protein
MSEEWSTADPWDLAARIFEKVTPEPKHSSDGGGADDWQRDETGEPFYRVSDAEWRDCLAYAFETLNASGRTLAGDELVAFVDDIARHRANLYCHAAMQRRLIREYRGELQESVTDASREFHQGKIVSAETLLNLVHEELSLPPSTAGTQRPPSVIDRAL